MWSRSIHFFFFITNYENFFNPVTFKNPLCLKLKMRTKSTIRKFWDFLQEDTWQSFVVTLLIAFILIKFVLFPLLSFITGTSLPLVIVESCSMYHTQTFTEIMTNQVYKDYSIDPENATAWPFQNGFAKGDIIFVVSPKNIKIGDVIIYEAGQSYPIIHRVIRHDSGTVATKGDNNPSLLPFEPSILEEKIMGKAVFRIPALGWVKLIFFEPFHPSQRGFCK